MTCQEFKEWLVDRDFAEAEGSRLARAHMQHCPDCRKLYELDEELEAVIRRELVPVGAPASLEKRIDLGLERTAPRRVFSFPRFLVPALAIAGLLLLFFVPRPDPHRSHAFASFAELGRVAAQDHRSATSMAFTAPEVADIPAWFAAKVGYPITLPDMAGRGLTLVGGRVCDLGACKAAYLIYRHGDTKVSLFILPAADARMGMEPGRSYTLSMEGNDFEFWQANGQLYTLVS